MLLGKATMKTGTISETSNRGKHITSHRELFILENGAIVIDNPGMREVGIADSSDGLKTTFDEIMMLAENCRFTDCTHTNERGCAIIEAVENGEIDRIAYENYLKLQREELRFEQTTSEKRRKDKEFGKMVKNIKNDLKKVNSKYAKDN
jgi:ribosome biogenesis GTPase